MEAVMLFLIKAAITQSILFCVYWLLFRRDTFYKMNRWYLLSAIVVSLIIPFIELKFSLQHENVETLSSVYQYVPNLNITQLHWWQYLDYRAVISYTSLLITLILLLRLLLQWISLRNIKPTRIVEHDSFHVCLVAEEIRPFSFGRNIYINPDHHAPEELNEIIAHELVHVLQKHSADILLVTINRCIFWWNPFAWLLTSAVKQNLEFICDDQVLLKGFDAQHYQYNLLRISQTLSATPIGQHFNFSNLKNRIHMMNKEKTRSLHRVKWLAIIPVVALVLLSFNQQRLPSANTSTTIFAKDTVTPAAPATPAAPVSSADTRTAPVTSVDVHSAPVTPQPAASPRVAADVLNPPPPPPEPGRMHGTHPVAPPPPPPVHKLPANVESVTITNSKTTVTLKNGKKEYYNLDDEDQRKAFESKYGRLEPPLPPPQAEVESDDAVTMTVAPSAQIVVHSPLPTDVYIMCDGKNITHDEFNKIDPKNIKQIDVLKGESAKTKYGDKGKSGVIEVTTRHQQ